MTGRGEHQQEQGETVLGRGWQKAKKVEVEESADSAELGTPCFDRGHPGPMFHSQILSRGCYDLSSV